MKFKHKKITKILNRYLYFLLVGFIFLIISISLLFVTYHLEEKRKEGSIYLNDLIKENTTDTETYLDIKSIDTLVATSKTTKDLSIYIVNDGQYSYLATLSNDLYEEIKNSKTIPYRIYGISKPIYSDIKNIIMNAYNNDESPNNDLTDELFLGIYGGIYIDTNYEPAYTFYLDLSAILASVIGIIFIITGLIIKIKINIQLKKLNENDIANIEKEIESDTTIKYPKLKLFLTKNYILSLKNQIKIINYQDIIWAYDSILKTKGLITFKSLIIMNNLGKYETIATINSFSKKENQTLTAILSTISKRNKNVLIGYEHAKEAKALHKELKKKAKQK